MSSYQEFWLLLNAFVSLAFVLEHLSINSVSVVIRMLKFCTPTNLLRPGPAVRSVGNIAGDKETILCAGDNGPYILSSQIPVHDDHKPGQGPLLGPDHGPSRVNGGSFPTTAAPHTGSWLTSFRFVQFLQVTEESLSAKFNGPSKISS